MKNIAIIYHDADWDGKLSNEVCRHWLRKLYPEAAIHSYGWDYGRPVPLPHGAAEGVDDFSGYDSIYIVDLSVDELMSRPELRDKIVWIDHHKSAIEKWDRRSDFSPGPGLFTGYRIDGVAACRLCWQWFFTAQLDAQDGGEGRFTPPTKDHYINRAVPEPELIRLAGEYDVWDHRDPRAKQLQFGLNTLTDAEFRCLIEQQFRSKDTYPTESEVIWIGYALHAGGIVQTYCDKRNAEYATAYAHTIKFEGLTLCALNIGQRGNSDLLRGGLKPEHQACFSWRWTGSHVLVSLYHAPGHEDLDLSTIATKYGGGGHRGACGFRVTLAQLEKILTP